MHILHQRPLYEEAQQRHCERRQEPPRHMPPVKRSELLRLERTLLIKGNRSVFFDRINPPEANRQDRRDTLNFWYRKSDFFDADKPRLSRFNKK